MPSFSKTSLNRLYTCHPDLVVLFLTVVKKKDCTILEGARSESRQKELYHQGKSTLDGVTKKSKHQIKPDGWSHAVDVAPYPVSWATHEPEVKEDWLSFAQLVLSTADQLGIKCRWGGDWNSNRNRVEDPMADPHQTFNDWPHWELVS